MGTVVPGETRERPRIERFTQIRMALDACETESAIPAPGMHLSWRSSRFNRTAGATFQMSKRTTMKFARTGADTQLPQRVRVQPGPVIDKRVNEPSNCNRRRPPLVCAKAGEDGL